MWVVLSRVRCLWIIYVGCGQFPKTRLDFIRQDIVPFVFTFPYYHLLISSVLVVLCLVGCLWIICVGCGQFP